MGSDIKNNIVKILTGLIYAIGLSIPLAVTLGRILIPDVSFDAINYHTFIGARGLDWIKFARIEFYPTGSLNYFPLLDMFNAVGRLILGYRLGALTELFFLYLSIWLIFLIFKTLNISTGNAILDALLKISTFISLETLFQLGTYYTDVINAFLIILALFTTLKFKSTGKYFYLIASTIVMSLAALTKYTNYIYFLPYIILLLIEIISKTGEIKKKLLEIALHLSIFTIINGPWMIWNYLNTGNPIFPYFNSFFKSKYFDNVTLKLWFGPENVWQTIFYPIYLFFNNIRLGEYHELIPDYKISLYIIILFLSCLLFIKARKENPSVWYLYQFFVLSYVLWVCMFGYARYMIALEWLAGILLLVFFSLILAKKNLLVNAGALILLALFMWQNCFFVYNNLQYDISWRPNFWFERSAYLQEAGNIFNNTNYYPHTDNADVYINCTGANLGYMVPSNLVSLPVLDLQYNQTGDENQILYKTLAINRLPDIQNKKRLVFATIIRTDDATPNIKDCHSALDSIGATITNDYQQPFLGFDGIQLEIIKGTVKISSFEK
jgi:hypothetical protein